jgi:hypothetical protein
MPAGFKPFVNFRQKRLLIKQSEVEPDMPKMERRGDFSHFCPCRALARLRTQKQKFIHADTVLGAGSLKQTDFCVGKA